MEPNPRRLVGPTEDEVTLRAAQAAFSDIAEGQLAITYEDFLRGASVGKYVYAFHFDGEGVMSRKQLRTYHCLIQLYMTVPMVVLAVIAVISRSLLPLIAYPAIWGGVLRRLGRYPRPMPELWTTFIAVCWAASTGPDKMLLRTLAFVGGGYLWGALICLIVEKFEFGCSLQYALSDEETFCKLRDSGAIRIEAK